MPVEELKPLNFLSSDRYYASIDGHIYTKKKDKFARLSEYVSRQGYLRCCLTVNNKQYRKNVHSLVLTAFNGGKPSGFVCRHLDGNKLNNDVRNLTWGTQKENIHDCKKHGTSYEGERHYLSHVSDKIVRTVRVMYANGCTQKHIAETLGISKYSVHNYVRGKSRRSAGCL